MNRLNTSFDSFTYPLAACSDLGTARRLIVLVPAEADATAITRRVWEMANVLECPVLFLSLYTDVAQEASLRRQLVTMSAIVRNGKVCTDVQVQRGSNWIRAVKSNLEDGDLVVCFAEQHAGLLHKPLSQILQSNIQAPVYILSGVYPRNPSGASWVHQVAAWTGSLGLLLGAFVLQIRILSVSEAWAQTTLLVLSVMGEVLTIWGWNSLFS